MGPKLLIKFMEKNGMKRVFCAVIALMMCFAMMVPAFAAEGSFVPSITYKDGPSVVDAAFDGEDVSYCVFVTSIQGAKNKSTDIFQEDRDELLSVYEQLTKGTMTLPLEGDYVIRDLVDVSFAKNGCVEFPHDHDAQLDKAGTQIEVTFDLGNGELPGLKILHYSNGEWKPVEIKSIKNGKVTCVFEDFCPVAFTTTDSEAEAPKTGDTQGSAMWIGLMVVSAAALVVLLANRRKIAG